MIKRCFISLSTRCQVISGQQPPKRRMEVLSDIHLRNANPVVWGFTASDANHFTTNLH